MLLTSWVRSFAQSIQAKRRSVRRGRYRNHLAWHGSSTRARRTEALEARQLLTAFVVDQQFVDARNGVVNIRNVDLDIDSDGTPEFDSIVVDSVQISGAGTGINITLSGLDLDRIAFKQVNVNGVGVEGIDISLTNVDLNSLVVESSNVTSDVDPGVDVALVDVQLPELTVYQSIITGGFGSGLRVDLSSQSRNSTIGELDVSESTIDGVELAATGRQLQVFDVIPGATALDPVQIVAVDHGLQSGTEVTITGVNGVAAANTRDTLTVVDENTFKLDNTKGGSGVYLSGGSVDVTTSIGSVRITKNSITGNNGDDGLSITLDRAAATSLAIENNTTIRSVEISLTDAPQDGVTIRNNTIDAIVPQVDGIHFDITRSQLTNLRIDGNKIQGNGVSGSDGIVVNSIDSNVYGAVSNNTVDNTLGDGLRFDATSTAAFVTANRGPVEFDFSGFSAETTLVAALSTTDTLLQVVDGRAFRAQQYIQINDEVMFVSAVAGNSITVVRAQRSTLALPHEAGARVISVTAALSGSARGIFGNTFSNNDGAGFRVSFNAGAALQADVTKNSFIGNQTRGIDVTVDSTRAAETGVARGGISRTDTTLNVLNAAVFGAFLTPFNIQVEGETLTVTGINGNTLNVIRGVNGTQAAFHATNTPVTASIGDGLNLNIGGATTASRNTFTGNRADAISINLLNTAAGSVAVRNNVITASVETSDLASDGNAIAVRLTGTAGQNQATATLRRSIVDSNLIGTAAVTTLSSSVTAAATVFTVADTSIFAIGSSFRVDGEEMNVTNIVAATRTLTVLRARNGTTATTHAAGALLIPTVGGNQGRGFDFVSQEKTTLEDLLITNNVIANNTDDGVRIRREGEGASSTVNPTSTQTNSVTISSNTINRNATRPGLEVLDPVLNLQTFGAGIEIISQHGSLDSLDVEISRNNITGNRRTAGGGGANGTIEPHSTGISLRAEADAVILANVIDNVVTYNEGNGIYLTTREESPTDARDIGGLFVKNTVSFNGLDGIEFGGHFGVVNLLEIGRTGTDPSDGRSLGNVISNNGDHGININHGGNASIVNNQISNNGANPSRQAVPLGTPSPDAGNQLSTSMRIPGSGIFLFNADPSGQTAVNVVIDQNTIRSNLAMGIDLNAIGAGSITASTVFATIRDNLISINQNDGVELSGPVNATLLHNTLDRNLGRGLDIMNAGTSSSNYRIGNGLETGRNTFIANGQEGIMYLTSASAQDQNLLSSDVNAFLPTGLLTTLPQAILQIDTNTIKDNGTNNSSVGSGLVMRIGSSQTSGNAFDNQTGTATGIGSPNGIPINTVTGAGLNVNARTNARVVGNDFEGNFGSDMTVAPFVSTINPPTTAGVWGRNEARQFAVDNYTSDPLSRLNLQMQSNRGNGLDVIQGLVGYTNPEGVFKSRDGAVQGGDSGGDSGPFSNISRLRSITQIPSRMAQGLPGDGFPAGFMLPPGPGPFPTNGPDPYLFTDYDIADITGGDGQNDLVVTTEVVHGYFTGQEVQVAGARGIGSNGAQHMHAANGKWRIQVIDALTFRLVGTAGNGGLAYFGQGRVWIPDPFASPRIFLYPGMGPSTFRIASNFDTAGAGTQNNFTSGDNFYNYQGHAWETWTPLKSLTGVVTNVQQFGASTIRVTSPSHGLTNQRVVRFDGIAGSEDINTDTSAFFLTTVIDADTFEITLPGGLDDNYLNGGEWRTVDDSFLDPRAPTFPQPIINDVTPDPRTTNSGVVTIKFSEPVTNVDIDDFLLKRDGVPVDISGLIVNQIDSRTVTIDLSSVTTQEGLYELTQDNRAPEAKMVELVSNSLTGPVGVVTINFTENVTGVDINDFVLQRNVNDGKGYVPINLSHLLGVEGRFGANLVVNQISPKQYTVDLTALTNDNGDYRFSLLAPRADTTVAPVTSNVSGQPVLIRSQNPHNLSTGMTVEIDQINGNFSTLGSLNGQSFVITVINEYEFRLNGTTSNGASTAGGRWFFRPDINDETGRPFSLNSFGDIADARISWTRQNSAPTADIIDVTQDPRATAVSSVQVVFSEPVRIANVGVGDFRLTRDVGFGQVPVTLTSVTVTALDPDPTNTFATRFVVNNLGVLTSPDGRYRLTLITTDSSRITDQQGSFLANPALDEWVMDTTGPFPSIQAISPQMRTVPVDTVTFTFNQNVNGVDLTDANTHFLLTRDTGSGPVGVPLIDPTGMAIPIIRNSGSTYELNLASVTGDINGDSIDGRYVLTLRRGTGIALASNGRPQAVDGIATWSQDATAPLADIEDIDPNPRIQDAGNVIIRFSELITGLNRFNAATDFELTRDIGDGNGPQPVSLAGVRVRPIGPRTSAGVAIANPFDLTTDLLADTFVLDLSTLTTIDGIYTLSMKATGAITDATGNAFETNATSTDTWILLPKGTDTQIIDAALPARPVIIDPRRPTPNFSLQSSLQAALQANYAVGDDVDRFFLDLTPPQVVPGTVIVDPDPRSTSVGIVTIAFTEAVSGVNLSDLVLRRNGVNVSLNGLILNTISSSQYSIDLNLVTGAPGSYELLVQAPGSLIQDAAGNALQGGLLSLDTWVVENIGPSATISVTSPRTTSANDVVVDFTKNIRIADFGLSDLRLERDVGNGYEIVPITTGMITPVAPVSGFAKKFTVNLSAAGLTDVPGNYRITLVAKDSGIVDQAGIELAGDASTVWILDNTKPLADIIDVLPDPLPPGASAGIVNILFTEDVVGVDIDDFTLSVNGVPVSLTGAKFKAETLRRYTIDLTTVSKADATYELRLNKTGSGIKDLAGNDLATGAISSAITAAATTITLSDVKNFTGVTPFIIQIDSERMEVIGVNGNQFTVVRGDSGTTPAAHVAQAPVVLVSDPGFGASDIWFQGVDTTAPTGKISSIASPRNTPVGIVTINFSEAVTGVDLGDFTLTHKGSPVNLQNPDLDVTIRKFPGSESQYLLDLTSATFLQGTYVLSLVTTDTTTPIRDLAASPNTFAVGSSVTWDNKLIDPSATISDVTPNPRLRPAGIVTIDFTQPVQGLDISDFRLTRDGQQVSLRGIDVQMSPSGATQYFVDLTPVTGTEGEYRFTLQAAGSQVTEISTGDPLLSDAFTEWESLTEITVTSTSDVADDNPGDGTVSLTTDNKIALRAAVMEAGRLAGDDIIVLDEGIYTLSIAGTGEQFAATGDLDIFDTTGTTTIRGKGAGLTIIDGGQLERIFHVTAGAKLVLEGVTIRNGQVTGSEDGGGIRNDGGIVEIRDSVITNNRSFDDGGAINNDGQMLIVNSTITRNQATNNGGAIRNVGALRVENSLIGGVYTPTSNPVVDNRNRAGVSGGAIVNLANGTVAIVNSTVSGNTVTNPTGNGGGISNQALFPNINGLLAASLNAGATTLLVANANVFPNQEVFDIRIDNEDIRVTQVTNNTFTITRGVNGTVAAAHTVGAVVALRSNLSLVNATIDNNQAANLGGGLHVTNGRTLVKNTIVGGTNSTTVATNGPDVWNNNSTTTIVSLGGNVVARNNGATAAFPTGATVGTVANPVNPGIDPLANNGGPTLTHALRLGSVAIDIGQPQLTTLDQRGITRVLTTVDAGAYEFGGFFVDSTVDSPDVNPGDGIVADNYGRKTLRAAIMEANALAGPNAIKLADETYQLGLTELDKIAPTVDIVDVTDPLQDNKSGLDQVDSVVLQFSEPVNATPAQILAQLQLRYTVAGGSAALQSLASATITRDAVDITRYTISGLRNLLTADGLYEFRFVTTPVIADFENNALADDKTLTITGAAAIDQFTRGLDKFSPTAALSPVSPNPRTTNPGVVTLNFSEPVSGINLSAGAPQFTLTYNNGTSAVNVPLTSAAVQQITQSRYELDLTNVLIDSTQNIGLDAPGTYTLTFDPALGGGTVTDIPQNPYAGGILSDTWTVVLDNIAPVADIVDVPTDPRIGSVGVVTIKFDENVVGVDLNNAELQFDLTIDVDGPGPQPASKIDLSALTVTQVNDSTYTVDLSSVTTRDGFYTLTLDPATFPLLPIADTVEVDALHPNAPNKMAAAASETFVIGDDVARFTNQAQPIPVNGMSRDDAASFGDIDITAGDLTIIGGGSNESVIDGGDIDRVLDVYAGVTLHLINLGVSNGKVLDTRDGGGIRNENLGLPGASLIELLGVELASNDAGGRGGAVFSNGDVIISDSTISSNSADFGAGVYNEQATLTVSQSAVTGNVADTDGGGIYNDRTSTVTFVGSNLSGNTAQRHGGGLYNNDSASASLVDSTLASNSAANDGGAVFNELAADLSIDNSTLAANAAERGGGIFDQDGNVTVTRSALSANTARTDGGALYITSAGVVLVSNSTFSGNKAENNGGAIDTDGTLTLDSVVLADNKATADGSVVGGSGGAIDNSRSLTIQSSFIQGNSAEVDGGGIRNSGNGSITINLSTISDNAAGGDGGSIYNTGSASITFAQSTVANSTAGDQGGGLYQGSTGAINFTNGTISENRAAFGGGVYNTRTFSFTNSTLSSNIASTDGGGLYNDGGTATLQSSTVFANRATGSGGGIRNVTVFGPVNLKNTIVAANLAPTNPDVSGVQFVSQGNNLIGNVGTVSSLTSSGGNLIGTTATPIDPLLGPLQDNGGPTRTHALLFGSPARDKGSNVGVSATDQRGFARIFDGDGNGTATVDIGSFESGFVVNTFLDTIDVKPGDLSSADGAGNSSLRAAVMEANALDGDDTILLLPGTFKLTIAGRDEDGSAQGDLDITTDSLTIIGSGTDQTIVDAALLDRVFHVKAGATLNLKNLTVIGGRELLGGGIYNQGTITLENVIVTGNQADFGGGLYNDQVASTLSTAIGTANTTLQIANPGSFPTSVPFDFTIGSERVRVTNVATIGAVTTFTVIRGANGTTPVAHNLGDKVTMIGSATIADSTISGNEARLQGGGLFNRNPLTLTRVNISNNNSNSQGGGLFNRGAVSMTGTTFDGNQTAGTGGAIYNDQGVAGETASISIDSSTLSNNVAGIKAGAIYNNDAITILNSTISSNSANAMGGGIINTPHLDPTIGSIGTMSLTNTTIVLNSTDGVGGGFINQSAAGRVNVRNTIISGNTARRQDADVRGAFTSLGANFIGDAGTSSGFINLANGDQVGSTSSPFDAVFGPLADNGGPTKTHSLLSGSPAIDQGNNSGGEPVDQRGGQRPTDTDADVGSFEVQENHIVIRDVTAAEGDTGETLFIFAVTLAEASAEPVTVSYRTEADTAKTGSDFLEQTGTITFAPGELTKTIVIEVNGDISSEAGTTAATAEKFFVRLFSPVNAIIDDGEAEGHILNDDAYVSVSDVQIVESDTGTKTATFTVTLDVPSFYDVTIDYSTANDSAVAGSDYESKSGSLFFSKGETTKTVSVTINGDTSLENYERFFLNALSSSLDSNGDKLEFAKPQGIGTILNDEVSFVSTDTPSVTEGNTGSTTSMTFTVSLAQPVGVPVTVDVSTLSGTAIGGSDYQSKTQALTFNPNSSNLALPGDTSKNFTVNVIGDSRFEPSEKFSVTLANVTRAGVALPSAMVSSGAEGTIINDDSPPTEWRIRQNSTHTAIEVYKDNVFQFASANLTNPVSVTGTVNDDVFMIDYANGNPVPTGGLNIDGGAEIGGDSVVLTDSNSKFSATNIIYTATGGESGTISVDGSLITYSDLEPIVDNLPAVSRTVNLTDAVNHKLQIVDDTSIAGNSLINSLESPATFESISFLNPSSSLTVNLGSGNNNATIDSLDPAFAGTFILNAGAGNDTVSALNFTGTFTLNGDGGNDSLSGGNGNDTINGGAGSDTLFGSGGNDTLRGHDTLTVDDNLGDTIGGGIGNDSILGQGGNDNLLGANGDDTVDGGAGNDTLSGGNNNDSLLGGDGVDALSGDDGADTLQGNAGNDTLSGGVGADSLDGGADNDSLLGGADNDTLNGSAGNDLLSGELGDDSLLGGADNDTLDGGAGNNSLNGEAGTDRVDLDVTGLGTVVLTNTTLTVGGSPTTFTSVEQFKFVGGAEANLINAAGYTLGAVTIIGNGGNDSLFGGSGADSIDAGDGNDSVNGGGGNDTVLGGLGNDSLRGGLGNDSIIGAVGIDTIFGEEGDDIIDGGDGADSLNGDAGNDLITGAAAIDIIFGGDGNDSLYGGDAEDTINGGAGNDFLLGDNDNDSLIGGAGNDTMLGAAGFDTLVTGDGSDFVDGQGSSDIMQVADGTSGNDAYSLTYSAGFLNLAKTSGTAFSVMFRRTEVIVLNTLGGADVFTTGDLTGSVDTVNIQLSLGDGDDSLNASANTYALIAFQANGGAGNDSLVSGNGLLDSTPVFFGRNVLDGDFGVDFIVGGNGSDVITGGEGNDNLYGGGGNDTVQGGVGNDYIRGNGGNDSILAGDGNDTVKADAGNDVIDGGAGNDKLAGDAGNDAITGGDGDDTIKAGDGNDFVDGGNGADVIRGDAGNDRIVGGAGRDILLGDDGNDTLSGTNDPDVIIGGLGVDSLLGNGGVDTLVGGTGSGTPPSESNFYLEPGEVDNAFVLSTSVLNMFNF